MNATPATQDDIKDLHRKIDDKHDLFYTKMDALLEQLNKGSILLEKHIIATGAARKAQEVDYRHAKGATDRISKELKEVETLQHKEAKKVAVIEDRQKTIIRLIAGLGVIVTAIIVKLITQLMS